MSNTIGAETAPATAVTVPALIAARPAGFLVVLASPLRLFVIIVVTDTPPACALTEANAITTRINPTASMFLFIFSFSGRMSGY
jgi:hypothetical protein